MKSRLEALARSDFQPLRITIFYEDLPTVLRANALIECPCYWNEPVADAETEFWRFDLLSDVSQRKAAAKMAERSRLVVLSARSQTSISPAVESCINAWLEGRAHHSAAFAVLFADSQVCRSTRETISNWWRRANDQRMKFYCDLPEWQSDFLFGKPVMRRGEAINPMLASFLN